MDELPANWKQVLKRCNFFLARREIGDFFEFIKKQGEAEGGEYVFPVEHVRLWEGFADVPCYDTAVQLLQRWPTLFRYFEGSCPDGRFYRTGWRTTKTFELGEYTIGMPAHGMIGLRELTREEYAFFPRPFRGEVIYHAPPAQFMGCLWDMMVGVIDGRVWKLAANLEIKDRADMVRMVRDTYKHCETFLGTPTEERQGLQLWKMADGNVILEVVPVLESYAVNLFVTDGEVVRSAGRAWNWKSILGRG